MVTDKQRGRHACLLSTCPWREFQDVSRDDGIANGTSADFSTLATVAAASHCRRVYDGAFDRLAMLKVCGPCTAVVATFTRSTPISAENVGVQLVNLRRTSMASGGKRFTIVFSAVPTTMADAFAPELDACGGATQERSTLRLMSIDVVQSGDGSARVGVLFSLLRNTSWAPSFLMSKFLATIPTTMVTGMLKMAATGMLPRRVIALTDGDPKEPLEEVDLAGSRVFVSSLLRDALLS